MGFYYAIYLFILSKMLKAATQKPNGYSSKARVDRDDSDEGED